MLELGVLDYVLLVPGLACSYVGIPVVLLAVFYLLGKQAANEYAVVLLGGFVLTLLLKSFLKRKRPTKHGSRKIQLRWMESNFSLPSGDTYQAGCLAYFLFLYVKTELVFALPILVGFARVYFGFHWIGDTVVGGLLGVGMTKAVLGSYYCVFKETVS